MDEAQYLADRVAVIAKGQIVAEGTPDTLGGRETASTLITFQMSGHSIEGLPSNEATLSENGRVTVRSMDPTGDLHRITGWAIERGVELAGLSVTRPSLEDIYLELIGEGTDA